MSIFYLFIALPVIFMVVLSFIFSSSLTQVDNQQYLVNCPYPTFSSKPELDPITPIDNNQIIYTMNYSDIFVNDVFVFHCSIDTITDAQTLSLIYYNSSDSSFTAFDNAFAWMGHINLTMQGFFQKVQAQITLWYLYINAPAEVSGLAFFTYMYGVMLSFVGLGVFMIIRGTGS